MRSLFLALSLLVSGCALPVTYTPITPQPTSRNGDVQVSVPHGSHERRANQDGAAECAKYGRGARYDHRDGGRAVYECVDPATAAQGE
jgi:hypothetical protein